MVVIEVKVVGWWSGDVGCGNGNDEVMVVMRWW